jgi:biopolymer transport protein ExbB/TolQ
MGSLSFFFKAFSGPGSNFMWVILVMACLAIGLVVWRIITLVKGSMGRANFLEDISKLIKAGDLQKAIKYSSGFSLPLAKIFSAILQKADKSEKAMNRAVDEVFLTEGPRLQRITPLLVTIANIATLTGLLGTIFGLILAFDAVANVPAAQRPQALATGIAVAMNTTFFGLIVAIPTLIAHGIIGTQADRLIEEMDEKSAKLINILVEG